MYLSSAGRLGIGTTSPLGFLHVSLETGQTEPAAAAADSNGAAVISGSYGNLELLSRDTDATTATSIGFGRFHQTSPRSVATASQACSAVALSDASICSNFRSTSG